MSRYLELKVKHKKEINEFPMFFPLTKEDFNKGMISMGLTPEDLDKVCYFENGGFLTVLKKDAKQSFSDMLKRHSEEMKSNMYDEKIGDKFIYEMFLYELKNNEYGYTGEVGNTLDSLGFTIEDINNDDRLKKGLDKAKKTIMES